MRAEYELADWISNIYHGTVANQVVNALAPGSAAVHTVARMLQPFATPALLRDRAGLVLRKRGTTPRFSRLLHSWQSRLKSQRPQEP